MVVGERLLLSRSRHRARGRLGDALPGDAAATARRTKLRWGDAEIAATYPAPDIDEVRNSPSCPDDIAAYPWPIEEACRVSFCESTWQSDAVSPDGSNLGYFQINAVHSWRVGGPGNLYRLLDPATNVSVAYDIWREQGWGPWACKPY